MPSMPMIGSSPTCWMLRMSAIGTSPSRTARSCSGPLKPSWPPDFTSISTAPAVPFLDLVGERLALMVWKLPSGHTVASGSFNAACACTIAGAPSNAPIPTPAFKASLRPSFIEDPICSLIPRTPLLGRRYSAARGGL